MAAIPMVTPPMINALLMTPKLGSMYLNVKTIGTVDPRTKLGTVEATVERMFVPNCSAAFETNKTQ